MYNLYLRDTVKEERSFGPRIHGSFANLFHFFHLHSAFLKSKVDSSFEGDFEGCHSPESMTLVSARGGLATAKLFCRTLRLLSGPDGDIETVIDPWGSMFHFFVLPFSGVLLSHASQAVYNFVVHGE
jgi:hypothetical protein